MTANTQLLKANSRELHDRIISACRELMIAGNIRPIVSDIAVTASCSRRSVHDHFDTLEALYIEALDQPTCDALWKRFMQIRSERYPFLTSSKRVRSIVLGRIAT